jgi:hypothetical protein
MPELSYSRSHCPEPSTSSSHYPEPASPAPTEIAYDTSHIEQSIEEQMDSLLAASNKVRDFAFEPTPKALKSPEIFDPMPNLIALDWHLRNPHENYGLLSGKSLFRLIKMDIRGGRTRATAPRSRTTTTSPTNRYPFIVVPLNQETPTPSQRVRLRR